MDGLIVQKHTEEQRKYDSNTGWRAQLSMPKTPYFPGDMGARGNWTFEDSMSWCAYSQFSCGVGVANLYSVKHAERLIELTKQYGKVFIFTVSRTKPLLDYVLAHPEHFVVFPVLQESWMDGCPIYIVGSKT